VLCALHVFDGQHAADHGMVLIVVAVHPVAADGLRVFDCCQELPNDLPMLTVLHVIDGVSLRLAKYHSVFHVLQVSQSQAGNLPGC